MAQPAPSSTHPQGDSMTREQRIREAVNTAPPLTPHQRQALRDALQVTR